MQKRAHAALWDSTATPLTVSATVWMELKEKRAIYVSHEKKLKNSLGSCLKVANSWQRTYETHNAKKVDVGAVIHTTLLNAQSSLILVTLKPLSSNSIGV